MTRKSIFAKINNQDGAALITVLVVFLTLVVIVTSSTYAALGNYERAKKSSDHASAYYIAEAGLFEAKTYLTTFFESKQGETIESSFAKDFIYAYAVEDTKKLIDTDKVETDYGKVMNLPAKSQVTLKYSGKENESLRFTMKSKGFLGDETRVVETSFLISSDKVEGEKYQPDSVVALDPSSNPNSFPMPNYGVDLIGPIITNKPIKHDKAPKVKGPIITNNIIDFTVNSANWTEGVLISSSKLNFPNSDSNSKFKAIILKEGGNFDFANKDDWRNIKVDYIYIPKDKNDNYDKYFLFKGEYNQVVKNTLLKGAKFIYYNPQDYDPYNDTSVDADVRLKIFGKDPRKSDDIAYDYRDYFKSSFILDNMNGEDSFNAYLPQVKLPERPKYSDFAPDSGTLVDKKAYGVTYLDSENNLNFTNSTFRDNKFHLNLAEETRNDNYKRSFNSIKIGGGYDSSQPLYIMVEDKDIELVTKSFEMTKFVEIIGTGSLRIYVIGEDGVINENHFKADDVGSVLIRDKIGGKVSDQAHQFQLVVYEARHSNTKELLTFRNTVNSNNVIFQMSIFSQNLNFYSSAKFIGVFVSGEGESVKFADVGASGKSSLIYTPNAKLTLVGGHLKGVITAKDYEMGSNGSFGFSSDFDKSFVDDILVDIIVPGGNTGESSSTKNKFEDGEIKEVGQ